MKKYISLIIISSLFVGFVAYATIKTKQEPKIQTEQKSANSENYQEDDSSRLADTLNTPTKVNPRPKNKLSYQNNPILSSSPLVTAEITPPVIIEPEPQKIIPDNKEEYQNDESTKNYENDDRGRYEEEDD